MLLRDAQAERRALAAARADAEGAGEGHRGQLAARDSELTEVLQSRTHRAGQAVTAPVRLLRRITR